jgi:hypothetical protein
MNSDMTLLWLFLSCQVFLLAVIAVVRMVLPPVKPIELSEDEREYVVRAYRAKKSA